MGLNPKTIALLVGGGEFGIGKFLSDYKKENDAYWPILGGRPKKWKKENVDEWRDLLRKGLTRKEISKQCGVHTVVMCRKMAQELQGILT